MEPGGLQSTGSQRVYHNLVTNNNSMGCYIQLARRCFSSLLTGSLFHRVLPQSLFHVAGPTSGGWGYTQTGHLCPPATAAFRASPSGGDWRNHSHLLIQLTLTEHLVYARLSFVAPRGQLGARQRGLPLRTLLCSSGETDSKQVNKPAKQDGFSISVMKKMKQGAALEEEATFFFFFFGSTAQHTGSGIEPLFIDFNTKSIWYWGIAN